MELTFESYQQRIAEHEKKLHEMVKSIETPFANKATQNNARFCDRVEALSKTLPWDPSFRKVELNLDDAMMEKLRKSAPDILDVIANKLTELALRGDRCED
jgi:hypothetical protein